MNNPQLLDRDHLARYTLGDAELEQEVLGLFIGQMPQTLSLLKQSSNPHEWLCAAHSIKGAARAVGAWKLADAAERAEQHASATEQWERLAQAIAAAIDEVESEINACELADA